MCDYSLMHVKSRAARKGDRLVTHSFGSTRGFMSTEADESGVAVCVRPGTELAFEQNVRVYGSGNPEGDALSVSTARFKQVDITEPTKHHDCIEFPNGHEILLNYLVEDQVATVIQMPVDGLPEHVDFAERELQRTRDLNAVI